MFFVTVGIVILFVSFIIAVFSLVREQDGREEPYLGAGGDAPGSSQPTPVQQQEVLLAGEPILAESDEGQDVQQQEGVVEALSASVEPFPWEVDDGEIGDLGQAVESANEILDEVDGQGRAVLSGEISVRDLQRKAD